jgi:hypothetical protein
MKHRLVLLLIVGAIALSAGCAFAGLDANGDPQIIGSWAQRFLATSSVNYDYLQFQWQSGPGAFKLIGNFDVFNPSWSGRLFDGGSIAAASGNPTYFTAFDLGFTTMQSEPISFVFSAWNGSNQLDSALASWNGSCWHISQYDGQVTRRDQNGRTVPEPFSIMLGIVGLGTITGFRRLRKA